MEGEIIKRPNAELGTLQDLDAFTDGWLGNRRLSENTRAAYRRDMTEWFGWCQASGLDPLQVTFVDVNRYGRGRERGLDASTVARNLSVVSSWYRFLVKIGALPANPVDGADRPKVSRDDSSTRGLTADEMDRFLAVDMPLRDRALLTLMADLGLRVSDALNLDIEHLTHERGCPIVKVTGKGGVERKRLLTPDANSAIQAYLHERARDAERTVSNLSGALFVTMPRPGWVGGTRLDRHRVFMIVRDTAHCAGLNDPDSVTPHSLRHAFATLAREADVPLEDVQDAMGHADPRTTRRYDRDRHNLDRDPSQAIWAARTKRRNAEGGS